MKVTRISLAIGLIATLALLCTPLLADPILPNASYQQDFDTQNVISGDCLSGAQFYSSPGSHSCSSNDYYQYQPPYGPPFSTISAYSDSSTSNALTLSVGADTEGSNLDGYLASYAAISFELEAFYIGTTPLDFCCNFTVPVIATLTAEGDQNGPGQCDASAYTTPICDGSQTTLLGLSPDSPYGANFIARGEAGIGNGSFDLTATLTYAIDPNQSDWNTNSQFDTNPADYVLVYSADLEAAQSSGTTPEPATCLLLATGIAMLRRLRRRK
jgi:hypothetical protein